MQFEKWLSPLVLNAGFKTSPLDASLRNFALTLRNQDPGLSRSNRGGWHSPYLDAGNATVLSELAERVRDVALLFLQKWKSPTFEALRGAKSSRIHFAALWVNVHETGNYNVEHQHAESGVAGDDVPLLSGVYYPKGPSGGAKLHFADCGHVPAKDAGERESCSVKADAGTLVLFPATLPHSVEPDEESSSGELRVSFAFNLIVRWAALELSTAVMVGNVSGTRGLLDEGVEINAHDPAEGFTPLHYAAEAGHMDVLRLLLEKRADPLAISKQQSLPVHVAAEAGQLNVVKELLAAAPHLVQYGSGSQNRTLLHIASANGQVDLLHELLGLKADLRSLQLDGSNALHASVQNGHSAATQLILLRAPDLVNEHDAAGLRPAHEAARGGHVAILNSLLQARADATGTGQDALTYWAAQGGHTAVLQSLLMSKLMQPARHLEDARISSTKGEAMANYLAAALIGSGSSPQIKSDELSPTHVAAQAGHSKVLAWLQRQGHSVVEPSSSLMQPLHLAASSGHLEVTKWLLAQGTSTANAKARGDISPLHMAALNGHAEVARLLLDMRCSASGSATDGSQPLHVAAVAGHIDVAKVLLTLRAQVDAATRNKLTPLHRAREAGHSSMVELLISQQTSKPGGKKAEKEL